MTGNPDQDEPKGNARLILAITLTVAILGAVFMVASMFWLKQQAAEHGAAVLPPLASVAPVRAA